MQDGLREPESVRVLTASPLIKAGWPDCAHFRFKVEVAGWHPADDVDGETDGQ